MKKCGDAKKAKKAEKLGISLALLAENEKSPDCSVI
jgi:hypothetical protein